MNATLKDRIILKSLRPHLLLHQVNFEPSMIRIKKYNINLHIDATTFVLRDFFLILETIVGHKIYYRDGETTTVWNEAVVKEFSSDTR